MEKQYNSLFGTRSRYASRVYPQRILSRTVLLPVCAGKWILLQILYLSRITYSTSSGKSLGCGHVYRNRISGNSVPGWSNRSVKCRPIFFHLGHAGKTYAELPSGSWFNIFLSPRCVIITIYILAKKCYLFHAFFPKFCHLSHNWFNRARPLSASSERNNAKWTHVVTPPHHRNKSSNWIFRDAHRTDISISFFKWKKSIYPLLTIVYYF